MNTLQKLKRIVGGAGDEPFRARNKLQRFPLGWERQQRNEHETIVLAVAASAAVLMSAPLLAGTASAASIQLAQVDVDVRVGPPAVRIEEERRPGVVIEERRRVAPGVVIEGTDGRRRDCVTRSESETRNGVTVTERERDCR